LITFLSFLSFANSQTCSWNSLRWSCPLVTGANTNPASTCDSWNTFLASINPSLTYSAIRLYGSNDPTGVYCYGAEADQLCKALATSQDISITCNARSWVTSNCGGRSITTTGQVCGCLDGYTVRPCLIYNE